MALIGIPSFAVPTRVWDIAVFRQYPEAVANSVSIAERCDFNLAGDLGCVLPDAAVPEGYTPGRYLRQLC